MSNKKLLITDKVDALLPNGLRSSGFDVKYDPLLSYQQICQEVKDFDGIIINSKVICDKTFLDDANHLDFIGRLGSGLDIVDLLHASSLNIEVISSPEGNANAVGEHTMGLLLGLLHRISCSHQDVRQKKWKRELNRGTELVNKTVGIIGFGHTGPAFASKLSGFDVRVLIYDKYKVAINPGNIEIENVNLDALLEQSDIVSLHLPTYIGDIRICE